MFRRVSSLQSIVPFGCSVTYDQYVSDAGKAMIEEAKKGIADGSITVEGAIGKEQSEIKAEIEELLAK